MKYRCLVDCVDTADGHRYKRGELIKLPSSRIKAALNAGIIEEVKNDKTEHTCDTENTAR